MAGAGKVWELPEIFVLSKSKVALNKGQEHVKRTHEPGGVPNGQNWDIMSSQIYNESFGL